MPDPKYKTPNGKIVSEKELKEKYGSKFDSLVSANTFSLIEENIYKTPNGSFEVESVLKKKYGDRFTQLVADKTFEPETVKKKESTGAIYPQQESESEPKLPIPPKQDGSLAGSGFKESNDSESPQKQTKESKPISKERREFFEGETRLELMQEGVPFGSPKFKSELEERIQNKAKKNDGIGFSFEKGKKSALQGIFEIPAFLLDQVATATLGEEQLKELNELDVEGRRRVIQNVAKSSFENSPDLVKAHPLVKWFFKDQGGMEQASEIANRLDEEYDFMQKASKQYEQSIGEDILDLEVGQASSRIVNALAETTPALMETMIPYVGLTTLGLGIASQKSKELQEEGDDLGVATSTNAILSGAVEAITEKISAGLGRKFLKSFDVKPDATVQTIREVLGKLAKDGVLEGGSESAAELSNMLIDDLVSGREDAYMNGWSRVVDAFIIGGVMGSGLAGTGKSAELAKQFTEAKRLDKDVSKSSYNSLPDMFKSESNIDGENLEISGKSYSKKFLERDLKNMVKKGEISQLEMDSRLNTFNEIKGYYSQTENLDLNKEQKTQAANLIKQKNQIEKQIEGKDPALVKKKRAEIEEINSQLENIQDFVPETEVVTEEQTTETTPDTEQIETLETETVQETEVDTQESETQIAEDGSGFIPEEAKGTFLEETIGKQYEYQDPVSGKTLVGEIFFDGQEIVFTDGKTEHSLGSTQDALSSNSISVTEVNPVFQMNESGKITYSGNDFEQGEISLQQGGLKSIKVDKQGNVKRVVVTDAKGNTRNVKGKDAVDLANLVLLDLALQTEGGLETKINTDETAKQTLEQAVNRQVQETSKAKTDRGAKRNVQEGNGDRVNQTNVEEDVELDSEKNPTKQADLENNVESGVEVNPEPESELDVLINKAREGDKYSQTQLDEFGVTWKKEPVVRFVGQSEVDALQNQETIEGKNKKFGVDVTKDTEGKNVPATNADYRVSFKEKGFDDKKEGSRIRMKNQQDGWVKGGYSLEDVSSIEQRQKDGNWKEVYSSETKNQANKPKAKQSASKNNDSAKSKTKSDEPQTTTKRVNPKGVKGEFDVEMDEGGFVKKIFSAKDGREIQRFVERKVKPSKKNPKGIKLSVNANFSRIESEATGSITSNQINEEQKTKTNYAVRNFEPSNEYEFALNYFASGGNVSIDSASKETGASKSELKWATGFKKESELPSVERASEIAMQDSEIDLDQSEVRNAIIQILLEKTSVSEIQNEIVSLQEKVNQAENNQELNAFLGSLTLEELALVESQIAEDSYLTELSYKEKIEYYEEQYGTEEQRQESEINESGRNDGESESSDSSLQERQGEEGTEITEQSDDPILKWLNAADKKLDDFGKNNLSSGLPVAVAQGTVKVVRAAYKAGKTATQAIKEALDYIKSTDWYKSLSKKEQKEVNKDLVMKAMVQDSMTEKESFEYVEKTFEEADQALENNQNSKKRRSFVRKLIQKITDRQFVSKKLVDEAGAQQTKDAMISSHGASGRAKRIFDKAFKEIYTDRISFKNKDGKFEVRFQPMSNKDRKFLDKMIQLKRFIAIDKNRKDRDLPPVTHPGFINGELSQNYLSHLKEKIGDKKFKDLERRSKIYFDTYKDLLSEMKKNGLISEEAFNVLNGLDYQPRLFLQHITDFDGNVSLGAAAKQKSDTGGLSQEQIKTLGEGSSGVLIRNSEWLLATSIDSRQRAMAMNTVNKTFMTKEFPAAKKRFNELKKDIKNRKKWSREDERFYEYFKELDSKVKDNPIIKTKKNAEQLEIDGMAPEYIYKRKYDKAPDNFKKAYYYENGVRQEFFLENGLHDSWFDNIPGFLNTGTKEVLGYATGSSLLKGIATGNNPAFALVNTPRDFMFNVVFSDQYSSFVPKAMIQVAKDTFKSTNEIRKSNSNFNSSGSLLDKYIYYGGDMAFLSTQGRLKKDTMLSKTLNKLLSPRAKNTGSKVFKSVTLRKISEYSEIMFRMALFQRTIKNELKSRGLKSIDDVKNQDEKDMIYMRAVAEARSLLDFNQGGSVTKDMEAFIPYINTAVQGTRVAADAFAKNPVKVTSKILQSAAMLSGATIASSLALITLNKDDDDEEKSAFEIYLHAIEGVSRYQRIQYMNIIDGTKDEDGNYRVWKIAKNQQLAPILNIADNVYLQFISDISESKRKDSKVNYTEAWTAIQNNIIPIDITSPITGNATKMPLLKAGLTYTTGYDFYRDQPLTFDQNQDNTVMEGAQDRNVDDFYKETGRKFRLSPARLKGAVESLITTPRTNPFVGVLYAGADAIVSEDKTLKDIAGSLGGDMVKSFDNRLISKTSEFNRQVNRLRPIEGELEKIKTRNDYRDVDIEEVTKDFYHNKLTVTEFLEKVKDYDSKEVKKVESKIKSLLKYRDIDRYVIGLAFETDREARALKMAQYYGNFFDGTPENNKIFSQMIELNVLDAETLVEYNKFMNEMNNESKKPQD